MWHIWLVYITVKCLFFNQSKKIKHKKRQESMKAAVVVVFLLMFLGETYARFDMKKNISFRAKEISALRLEMPEELCVS